MGRDRVAPTTNKVGCCLTLEIGEKEKGRERERERERERGRERF